MRYPRSRLLRLVPGAHPRTVEEDDVTDPYYKCDCHICQCDRVQIEALLDLVRSTPQSDVRNYAYKISGDMLDTLQWRHAK